MRTVRANLREIDASADATSSRFEQRTISWLGLLGVCKRWGDDSDDLVGVESA